MNIDLLLKNGHVITMDSERRILANASVAINGTNIVDIGDNNELDSKYTAQTVIDCTGKLIMPGLINLHSHAPMTLLRGYANDLPLEQWLQQFMFPLEKRFVDEEFCYYGALLAGIEMIESGTTCFADMYYYEDAVARATQEIGMRGVLAESVLKTETPDSVDFEAGLNQAEEYIKRWSGNDLIIPAVGPHAPYTCNDEILIRCKELADEYNVPLLIHVAETLKEIKDSMNTTGHRPVDYLGALGVLDRNVVAAHCVWLTTKEMELLRENGVKVAHNPTSNLKLGSGIAPVPELQDRGVVTGIGTDGCASNNDLDMIEEMRLASLLHKGTHAAPTKVDAMRVIAMATIEGAKALGIDDITGSIEKTKRADIAILNLDRTHLTPFYDYAPENIYSQVVYAAKSSDVETVIINGKQVMRDRAILTIEKEVVMAKCRSIAKEINDYKREPESVTSKLIRHGDVNMQPTYELQIKFEFVQNAPAVFEVLKREKIAISDVKTVKQRDIYFTQKQKREHEYLRFREEQVVSENLNAEPIGKPQYTLTSTIGTVIDEGDIAIMRRERMDTRVEPTIAFFMDEFGVEKEKELVKIRTKAKCVYNGVHISINIDIFSKPAISRSYVEVKSSAWTEKEASRDRDILNDFIRVLGFENEKQIKQTFYEMI
jgi:5-methylthioadenosine/S-adenosylhomocysteine deaminase